jgi:DnaK suppressor protein
MSAERAQLEQTLAEGRAAAATVQLDQSSVGRLSRMDAMQQQAMAQNMLARTERRMRMLDAALARIDAGTFGRCCACDVGVEPERLAADPAAVFCTECARQRQMG